MIYLILDTNIWLYISNGYDAFKSNYTKGIQTDYHFELLNTLKKKSDAHQITVLINDIILSEFEKNKDISTSLIEKIENYQKSINENLNSLKPFLSNNTFNLLLYELKKEIDIKFKTKIEENKKHILAVEHFLKSNCKIIPVSEKNYLDSAKLAIEKKAPFHNAKNNMADAVILLSVIEFIEENELGAEDYVIFVSNNTAEYGNGLKEDDLEFHNDILKLLGKKTLDYKKHLWDAIELSNTIIDDLRTYYETTTFLDEAKQFFCLVPYCNSQNVEYHGFGYFTSYIKLVKLNSLFLNPDQLTLFDFTEEEKNKVESKSTTEKGYCTVCGTDHIICPFCQELICDADHEGHFICTSCDSEFNLQYHSLLNEDILVYSKTDLLR